MPLATDDKNDIKFPEPQYLPLTNFKRGVITLVNQANLPKNALARAQNIMLVEDGLPSVRPGMQWYGTAPTIPAPTSMATLGTQTGSELSVGTYQYAVTFVNARGETTLGPTASITISAGASKSVMVGVPNDLPLGPGGTMYRNVYRTKVNGSTFYKIGQIPDNTTLFFSDHVPDTSLTVVAPTTNTAQVNVLNGFDYFDTGNGTHMIAVGDGNIFRSTDDAKTWTMCTGYTLNSVANVNMVQYNAFQYITSENQDIIVRYDGSTTLQTYTVLSTPAAPTAALTGLTAGGYNTYYKISAVSPVGFSIASAGVTVNANLPRENYNSTNYVTLTLPSPQTTQTRYDIYFSVDNLNFYYIDSIISSTANPQTTYKDDGTAIIVPSTIAPTTNTTQGPTCAELSVVGNRLYGVRDKNFPYRIWFSSGTSPLGSFSNGYDGGYLDWQPGGKFFPVHVEDYRDGKGTNIATVWLNSADSQGAIIQMSLGTLTVGNLSVTVPSAYKLPGSRGTPAPRSVVNVLNDYYFYNSQAFYSLGNRPNLLQILSTDELTANIRPTVRTINPAAEGGICSIYYDGRVYISVPYGKSSQNNATAVYDTELQAWLPTAYTVGFKQFKRYTSSDGVHHLLALKPGDNQLTEIGTLYTDSANIEGDYGQPFQTDLLTGLYSTQKDRYDFQFTEEMEYEFSDANGTINLELLGIDHAKGYGTVKRATLVASSGTIIGTGWDSYDWDSIPYDYTATLPTVVSEASTKRYTVVNRELNAVQWHITTYALSCHYTLRSLQTWGTDTNDAHPSKWRITANV